MAKPVVYIYIPNANEEVRIGSSFNHLIKVISETTAASDNIVWDFSNAHFLHPFFLAPLAIYKNISGKNIECANIPLHIQSYLNSVYFDRPLHFENEKRTEVESIFEHYLNRSYIPLCSFSMTDSNKETFGTIIQSIIVRQAHIGHGAITPISYLISELLDNIYEHSFSQNGYVFSQYLEREGVIDLCIADTGISIFGSYQRTGLHQDEINNDEATALWLANEGYSTKNRPEAENRGYGISTSKRMLVEGLGGSFFMLSGGAFHRFEQGAGNDYLNLKNIFHWKWHHHTAEDTRQPTKRIQLH